MHAAASRPDGAGRSRQETLGLAGRNERRTNDIGDAGLLAGSDAAAPSMDEAALTDGRPQAHTRHRESTDDRARTRHRESRGEASWPAVDRRARSDRRNQPTGFLSSPFRRGRRKAGRRAGERENIYVDVYSPMDVLVLLGIFMLNIGDALFTLLWLQRGGGEGNPIMQAMLDIGVGAFLFQKCIIVGVWLLILTAHRNYRAARLGLWSTLTIYTLIILYHLVLVGFGIEPVIEEPYEGAAVSEEMSSGYGAVDPWATDSSFDGDAVAEGTPTYHGAGASEMAAEERGDGGLDAQDSLAEGHAP